MIIVTLQFFILCTQNFVDIILRQYTFREILPFIFCFSKIQFSFVLNSSNSILCVTSIIPILWYLYMYIYTHTHTYVYIYKINVDYRCILCYLYIVQSLNDFSCSIWLSERCYIVQILDWLLNHCHKYDLHGSFIRFHKLIL